MSINELFSGVKGAASKGYSAATNAVGGKLTEEGNKLKGLYDNLYKDKATAPGSLDQFFASQTTIAGSEYYTDNPNYMFRLIQGGTTFQAYLPEQIDVNITADYDAPYADVALTSDPFLNSVMGSFGFKFGANALSMQVWKGTSSTDISVPLQLIAVSDPYEEIIKPLRKLKSLVLPVVQSAGGSNGFIQLGNIQTPGPYLTYDGNLLNDLNNALQQAQSEYQRTQQNVGAATGVASTIGAAAVGVGKGLPATFNALLQSFKPVNEIQVEIGNFMRLPSVVILSVGDQFNVRTDSNGVMISCMVTITFRSFVNLTSADISNLIGFKSTTESIDDSQFNKKAEKAKTPISKAIPADVTNWKKQNIQAIEVSIAPDARNVG